MPTIELSTFEAVTRLAQQYGPFLFAILFVLVVTRTAHKYYQESNTRQPPASDEEKRTYKSYFTTSAWAGIVLTLLSIGWWLYAQIHGPTNYEISVQGLQPNEIIESDYYRYIRPEPFIQGTMPLHNASFMITSPIPLQIGQKFVLFYYKNPADPNTAAPTGQTLGLGAGAQAIRLEITYSGHLSDSYRVTTNGGAVTLILANNSSATESLVRNETDPGQSQPMKVAAAP